MRIQKPTRPSERCGVITAEKRVGSRVSALSLFMMPSIPELMAKTAKRKTARKSRAKVKGPKRRAKADTKAAHGALPQMTNAQIAEAFRRFQAANPHPQTELK